MENLITGFHGIEEALRSGRKSGILFISKKNERISSMRDAAVKSGFIVKNISPAEMNKRFGDNRGAVLQLSASRDGRMDPAGGKDQTDKNEAAGFEQIVDSFESGTLLVIVLDGITDPHNYGAIIRSADQFGADLVVSRSRRSASDSDTVARTSAGAVNYVPVAVVKNLGRAIDYLKKKNFWVYGADMNGRRIDQTNLSGRTAIVLGSEGGGLSRLTAEKCDDIISIPSSGRIDSLNVSVAAGIIMYEVRRQQYPGKS